MSHLKRQNKRRATHNLDKSNAGNGLSKEWKVKKQGNLHAKKRVWVTGRVHSKKQNNSHTEKANGENGLQENYTVRTRETDPLR